MAVERYIKTIIYSAALVWVTLLYFNHEAIKSAWLEPLSTATTVVIYAVVAFDLWLWKLPVLHDWFVKRPVIDGTWKVEIRSNWTDPTTGSVTPPVLGYMVARQTLSSLSLRLMTAESSSELVGAEIVSAPDGLYCVSGVYRSEPRFQVRDRSQIHYGAVWLKIMDDDPEKKVVGHYWTDRETGGEMELSHRQHKKFQSFSAARQYFQRLTSTT